MHARTHVRTYVHTYVCTHARTHTQTHARTHTRIYIHTYIHTCAHIHARTHVRMRIHAHACTHAYMSIHIRTQPRGRRTRTRARALYLYSPTAIAHPIVVRATITSSVLPPDVTDEGTYGSARFGDAIGSVPWVNSVVSSRARACTRACMVAWPNVVARYPKLAVSFVHDTRM